MLQSLRSRPYLILLPLGTLIALHGLGMWLAHYASSAMPYPGQEHVLIQLGCYSVCVISALIFSIIPKTWNVQPLGSLALWLISGTAIVLMFAARRSEFLSLALLAFLFFTVLLLSLKGIHTGSAIKLFDPDALYSVLAFSSGAIGSTIALLIVSGLVGENWPVWKKMADGLIFGAFPVLALFGLVALAQRGFADEESSARQAGVGVFGGKFGAGLAIALALSYVFEPLASESRNTLFDLPQLLLVLRAALAGTILLVQFNILRAPQGQHPTDVRYG